jgi:hypothetical protein
MKVFFAFCIILLVVPFVYAESEVTLTNGNTMTWGNYWEQGDDYCVKKSGGIICFPKKEIKEIKEVKYDEDATVIEPKASSGGSSDSYTRNSIFQRHEKGAYKWYKTNDKGYIVSKCFSMKSNGCDDWIRDNK